MSAVEAKVVALIDDPEAVHVVLLVVDGHLVDLHVAGIVSGDLGVTKREAVEANPWVGHGEERLLELLIALKSRHKLVIKIILALRFGAEILLLSQR